MSTEKATRTDLIDVQLARAGWSRSRRSLLEEVLLVSSEPGRGTRSDRNFADYVLLGADGKPIALVEAKRTSRDELAGKRQAADYANAIQEKYGVEPFIFLTNGKEILFWDRARYAPRKISSFYTRDDLERVRHQRQFSLPLNALPINSDIAGRDYQNEAIRRVTEGVDAAKRKFLLVMATGTGKTRTTIALVDLLLRSKRTQRILFLADRRELVRQAMSEFKSHLPNESLARIESGETSGARIQFSTYSDNAKRNPLPGQQNDLWDALAKFKAWIAHGREGAKLNEKALLQPIFWSERWRQALLRDTADKLTPAGEAFSDLPDSSMWDGQVWGIHELFPEIPSDPKAADIHVRNVASRMLYDLVIRFFAEPTQPIWKQWHTAGTADMPMNADHALADWQKAIKVPHQDFNRAVREVQRFFEPEDGSALPQWKEMVKDALRAGLSFHETAVKQAPTVQFIAVEPVADLTAALETIAREVAKLDGFDVTLRSLALDQTSELKAVKHWVVPLRAWARNDEWQGDDGEQVGSHDADGLVRTAYVQAMLSAGLYDDKGALKDGLLDPDCIEAREWNLSAGQYKPFDFTQLKSDRSVAELIGVLKTTEQDIIQGLDKLLAMVEGRE